MSAPDNVRRLPEPEKRCGCPTLDERERCAGRADPRCAAGNCTTHCSSMFGCMSTCLRVWERKAMREASK